MKADIEIVVNSVVALEVICESSAYVGFVFVNTLTKVKSQGLERQVGK